MRKIYYIIGWIIVISLLSSCAPNKEVLANRHFYESDYESAAKEYKELVDEKYEKKDKSYIIYLMNYAIINHYKGNFEEAKKAFWAAYQIEYGKKPELAKAFELVKGTGKRIYRLTKREKALLHFFLGLEFLYLGDLEKALVEFKKINLIEEQKPKLPLACYFSGKIYEFQEDYDDCMVDYKNMAVVTEKDSIYIPYLEMAKISDITQNTPKKEEYVNWLKRMKPIPPDLLKVIEDHDVDNLKELIVMVDVDRMREVDSVKCYIDQKFIGNAVLTDVFRPGMSAGEVMRKIIKESVGYIARESFKSLLGNLIPGGELFAKEITGEGVVEKRKWYYAPDAFWLIVTFIKDDFRELKIEIWKRNKIRKSITIQRKAPIVVELHNQLFVHARYQSGVYPKLQE